MVGGLEPAPWLGSSLDECAAVGRLDIGGWYCSGVLIHPRAVLTVAHCGPRGGRAIPRAVALRTADLRDGDGAEITEGQFVAHEAFTRKGHPFDIALMILERTSTVPPVALATTAEMAAATEVAMAGFGCEREEQRPMLRFRRSVAAPIRFFAAGPLCSPPEGEAATRFDPDLEFLAGTEEAGPCFGDSGGPVYISIAGTRKLAGIISRPVARRKPFCRGLMILTRIDAFRSWIGSRVP